MTSKKKQKEKEIGVAFLLWTSDRTKQDTVKVESNVKVTLIDGNTKKKGEHNVFGASKWWDESIGRGTHK